MQRLPSDLLTLFADLADRTRTATPGGSVYRRERDGIVYVYAKLDAGVGRKDIFLGRANDPATAGRGGALVRVALDARGRRATVRLLRNQRARCRSSISAG